MISYIQLEKFDNQYISIKRIMDSLLPGTSVNYKHEDFLRMLLVDSNIFNNEYFENNVTNNSITNLFTHGGLRENEENKKYYRANVDLRNQLKAKNDEEPDSLVDIFKSTFKNIIDNLKDSMNSNYRCYIDGLFERLNKLVTHDNTYYSELYTEIKGLLDNTDVEKVLSLLFLIAIFQDEIYELFPHKYYTRWSENGFFPFQPEIKSLHDDVEDESQGDNIPLTSIELFEKALSGNSELGKIDSIDMCFHGGSHWRTDGTRNGLLTKAINAKVNIRVIVNTTLQVEDICSHMKQPNLEYVGFEKNLDNWVNLMSKYPDSVEVRIATIPLLRRAYIIKGEESKGWANIAYYSYGHVLEECQRINYRSGSNEYKLYANEFEYVWNHASVVYSESLLTESDEDNISFIRKALENQNCKSLDIISVYAYCCIKVNELIKTRLCDDSGFVLRMILPDPKNAENLKRWFINFDQELMLIFNMFESWTKKYPDRFLLHYTDLPITDMMYINKNEKKMLVEHLSIPNSTNPSLREEYSKKTTPQIYDAFENQFQRIWTDFSHSFIK